MTGPESRSNLKSNNVKGTIFVRHSDSLRVPGSGDSSYLKMDFGRPDISTHCWLAGHMSIFPSSVHRSILTYCVCRPVIISICQYVQALSPGLLWPVISVHPSLCPSFFHISTLACRVCPSVHLSIWWCVQAMFAVLRWPVLSVHMFVCLSAVFRFSMT